MTFSSARRARLIARASLAICAICAICVICAATFSGCVRHTEEHAAPPAAKNRVTLEPGAPMKTPEQVQSERADGWMALPNVIGTGIGEQDGRWLLLVFASAAHPAHAGIPAEADGYAVRVEIVGKVKAGEERR